MPIEVVQKPAGIEARQRTTGLSWAVYGAGVASGFFAGVLATGWEGVTVAAAFSAWEPAGAAATGLAAGVGMLTMLRARGANPARPALALLCGWAGSFLIVFGGRDVDDLRGSSQLRAWFEAGETRVGLGLLIVGMVLTIIRGGHHERGRDHTRRTAHVREDHAGGGAGRAAG